MLRQHSFHWLFQYSHGDYRSCRISMQSSHFFLSLASPFFVFLWDCTAPRVLSSAIPWQDVTLLLIRYTSKHCATPHQISLENSIKHFTLISLLFIFYTLSWKHWRQPAFWLSCLSEDVSTTMLMPKWLKHQNEKVPEWRKGGREAGKWAKKKMKKEHWAEKLFLNYTMNFLLWILDLTLIKVIGM